MMSKFKKNRSITPKATYKNEDIDSLVKVVEEITALQFAEQNNFSDNDKRTVVMMQGHKTKTYDQWDELLKAQFIY